LFEKYDKDSVNADRIDGLYSSTFTLSMDEPDNNDDDDVNDIFQEMVYDIQQNTSVASEVLFDTSVDNYAIPDTMTGGQHLDIHEISCQYQFWIGR